MEEQEKDPKDPKPKHAGGRPTKLTPEVHARLISLIQAGAYKEHAALAAGISDATFHGWVRRGEKGEEPFATFVRDLRRAEGEDIERTLEVINTSASAGDWKAAAWKLERKYPSQFGPSMRNEIRIQKGVESVLDAVRPFMSEGAYDELIAAIARVQELDGAKAESTAEQDA